MSIKRSIGNFISNHHASPIVDRGARLCSTYLSYYFNEKFWDMKNNGELLLLKSLASDKKMFIFDVGANKGDYVKTIRSVIPNSIIHCFEIVPRTRELLKSNLSNIKDVIIRSYGLSDKSGILEIGFNRENDTKARVSSNLIRAETIIECPVQTGDEYCQDNNIEAIDLLKIDTEGHEVPILEGFKNVLSKIKAIQFEYGTTWITQKHFLWEAYELLEPAGFQIGRLYPDGVRFKPYDRKKDEHFRMGNYVAVQKSYISILNSLNLNKHD